MSRLGLQLFTLRGEMETDVNGVLEKVKQIGYEGVELAGFGGRSAMELKRLFAQLDLLPASSHVQLESLEQDLERVVAEHAELGVMYLTLAWLPPERRNGKSYRQLEEMLNRTGEECQEAGLSL